MLHWRRKILRRLRRQLFWSKLFIVSCIGHLFILFFILFIRKGNNFSYNVVVNRKALLPGAPVIFLPLHKVVNKKSIITSVKRKKKNISSAKKTTKLLASKKKVVAKKTETKKVVQNKKNEKKVKTKKIAQKINSKKNTKSKQKKLVKQEVKQGQSKESDISPIYVGQLQMEALRMQNEMQIIMRDSWKPPAGLPKNLECKLKILIDWNGKATETAVEKSSGILMYDISARTAVAHMELPKWAHGKEFNITFKQ